MITLAEPDLIPHICATKALSNQPAPEPAAMGRIAGTGPNVCIPLLQVSFCMIRDRLLPLLLSVTLLALPGCASIDIANLEDILSMQAPLDEDTVAAGLREALNVGTGRAVETLSAEGGFGANDLLRIPIPENLETMTSRLRAVGLGDQVDRFEDQMNTAAEQAAGLAIDVFAGAIREMTIQDAFGILNGPSNAATAYFQERTTQELTTLFTPVVDDVMRQMGVVRVYEDLVTRYNAIPLVRPVEFNVQSYVVERTLDGMFSTLASEEQRIREDPLARTTKLLQRVFGRSTTS